jgi:hypothetical protein
MIDPIEARYAFSPSQAPADRIGATVFHGGKFWVLTSVVQIGTIDENGDAEILVRGRAIVDLEPDPDPVPPNPPEDPAPVDPVDPPADPVPVPDPDPVPVPTPDPDPVPATPIDPVPAPGLRAMIEGLRDRTTPNGVMPGTALKVVGQDPLPVGARMTATQVILTGGVTFDGWDTVGRGLRFDGRASVANVRADLRDALAAGRMLPLYAIDIDADGEIEWAENLEVLGTFATAKGPGAFLNARNTGSGAGFAAGKVRMLRRSRFEGYGADILKLHGVAGAEEVVEENYFGPQWGIAGSGAHSDIMTTVAAMGKLSIRRNLIDMIKTWDPAQLQVGPTNIFRISRNTGTDYPLEHVRIEENVGYYETGYYPVQVANNGLPNFNGPVEFVGNWLTPGANGGVFHPSTHGQVDLWSQNRHAITDALLAGPTGAAA